MSNYQRLKISDIEILQENYNKRRNDIYLPKYHVTPPFGLMNDPNGLIEVDGVTHIFYQWHPNSVSHDLKYWYHLSTSDFINYKDYKIAFKASDYTNLKGCFSGSAVKVGEDVLISYTGNSLREDREYKKRKSTQKIVKYDLENNLVIKELLNLEDKDYTPHNRDPQIFIHNDIKYFIFGAKDKNNVGCLVVYTLEDDYTLEKINTIYDERFNAYMWECPNISVINGKIVFIFSPQGIDVDGNGNFESIYNVVYQISDDFSGRFVNSSNIIELDKGFDFYAPQTYTDIEGNVIMLAWLGGGEISIATKDNGWGHAMSIPRLLYLEDNYLCQKPYKKLDELTISTTKHNGDIKLKSRCFKLEFEINGDFNLKIGNDKHYFEFSRTSETFKIERSTNDILIYNTSDKIANQQKREFASLFNKQEIIIYVDSSTIEIFLNGNRNTVSSVFYVKYLEKVINQECLEIEYSILDKINLYDEEYKFEELF